MKLTAETAFFITRKLAASGLSLDGPRFKPGDLIIGYSRRLVVKNSVACGLWHIWNYFTGLAHNKVQRHCNRAQGLAAKSRKSSSALRVN